MWDFARKRGMRKVKMSQTLKLAKLRRNQGVIEEIPSEIQPLEMGKKEEGAVGMNEDIEPTAKPITWRVVWSHRTPSQVQQSLSSFQEVVFGKELSHV